MMLIIFITGITIYTMFYKQKYSIQYSKTDSRY
jgi:hypothetical protein